MEPPLTPAPLPLEDKGDMFKTTTILTPNHG
jgi:hypothetical protein